MRSRRAVLLPSLLIIGPSCIIPDTEIQVYSTQECGDQYAASTVQATGITGAGKHKFIQTPEGVWIIRRWCLSPEQSVLMEYENSLLYQDILHDVIEVCKLRALEMELGQDNCSQVVAIAYSGDCSGEKEWCEIDESEDEVGVEADMMVDPST